MIKMIGMYVIRLDKIPNTVIQKMQGYWESPHGKELGMASTVNNREMEIVQYLVKSVRGWELILFSIETTAMTEASVGI